MKKGQASMFIFLGLLVLILAALVFYLRSEAVQDLFQEQITKITGIPKQFEAIDLFAKDCIQKTSKDALIYIGKQGGYLNPKFNEFNVAYYIYNNKIIIPNKETIEKEINSYVNDMLFFCTKGFIDFKDFDVIQGTIKTNTKIEDNKVILDVVYPLKISKDKLTFTLRDFKTNEFNVRLSLIYNVSNGIVNKQMENLTRICLSCLNEFAVNNNIIIDVNDYKDYREYVINDEKSLINGEPYEFRFLTEK